MKMETRERYDIDKHIAESMKKYKELTGREFPSYTTKELLYETHSGQKLTSSLKEAGWSDERIDNYYKEVIATQEMIN